MRDAAHHSIFCGADSARGRNQRRFFAWNHARASARRSANSASLAGRAPITDARPLIRHCASTTGAFGVFNLAGGVGADFEACESQRTPTSHRNSRRDHERSRLHIIRRERRSVICHNHHRGLRHYGTTARTWPQRLSRHLAPRASRRRQNGRLHSTATGGLLEEATLRTRRSGKSP